MRLRRLPRRFFARPTLDVAPLLLGKLLVRRIDGQALAGRIVEVEAYRGEDDAACHASRGRTPRTEPLYGRPGTAYVYLIYGIYHCLNVVTETSGFPAAVLIRGCIPLEGAPPHPARRSSMMGPGRLCRALRITRVLNGADLTRSPELWFADDGVRVPRRDILRTPRVGVDYAGDAAHWPWRFVLRESSTTTARQRG